MAVDLWLKAAREEGREIPEPGGRSFTGDGEGTQERVDRDVLENPGVRTGALKRTYRGEEAEG